MEKQFHWNNSIINYTEFGSGDEALICFHGYGQNCNVFSVLEKSLGKTYRIISLDLPYQGKTVWKEKGQLTEALMSDLMTQFLAHVGVKTKVSLLGYSIGGNYALGFLTHFPQRIKEVWLLAADGLKRKPAFNFLTKTRLGRTLFRVFVLYPGWVLSTVKLAQKIGFVKHNAMKFYISTIDTRKKRHDLFLRWSSTARISPGAKRSIKTLNQHQIPSYLIFGRKDSVISISSAEKFAEKAFNSHLVILDKGHQILIDSTNDVVDELLQKRNSNLK